VAGDRPREVFRLAAAVHGQANEHNALVPRDHWIDEAERQAIIDYFDRHPLEGYRRLTFMMLDADVVAVSPATTYRVLSRAGRLDRWNRPPSKKGTGFVQPLRPHDHWHIDVSYLNPGGTFYYLCSVLDGASRAIVHWELRASMTEQEVECLLERAKELYPEARPRIISDNGPQFLAKDFKEFIRISGMSHVTHLALLSAVERQDRTLAQNVEGRRAAPGPAGDGGGSAAGRGALRRSLQPRASAQRPRLCCLRWTPWRARRRRSGRPATASWKRHASSGGSAARRHCRHGHPGPRRPIPFPLARE
jgi:hypothetical protein